MGTLYVVATPIGNLTDMTERAIEVLKKADYILCEDTRTSSKLLNYFDIKNKLVSYHKFNEIERSTKIVNDLNSGKDIALISDAGTPCINDPGNVIVKKCRENSIPVIGVGGISAVITALSISGLDTSSFTFCGFFPRETKEQNKLIKNIKSSNINTYVFYESPKRIIKTLETLKNSFDELKISVSKELTKLHEKNYYGDIKEVIKKLKEDEKVSAGEYTFIIEKNNIEKEEDENTIESMLLDIMIKKDCSIKEAIEILNKQKDNLSKKEIYSASLNLKNMLK